MEEFDFSKYSETHLIQISKEFLEKELNEKFHFAFTQHSKLKTVSNVRIDLISYDKSNSDVIETVVEVKKQINDILDTAAQLLKIYKAYQPKKIVLVVFNNLDEIEIKLFNEELRIQDIEFQLFTGIDLNRHIKNNPEKTESSTISSKSTYLGLENPNEFNEKKEPIQEKGLETDLKKEIPNPLHDECFIQLQSYREKNPDFVFWLRQKNTNNRLNEGFWFQGTENYAFVGLYSAASGNYSTKSVGLVFWPSDDVGNIGLTFEVLHKGEKNEQRLEFYRWVRQLMEKEFGDGKGFEDLGTVRFKVLLADKEPFNAAFQFLNSYKNKMDAKIKELGLDEMFIDQKVFEQKLSITKGRRAAVLEGNSKDFRDSEADAAEIEEEKEIEQEIINSTELKNESSKDKIPFHYDRVVEDDKLGREPAAVAFSNLIKDDIFTQNLDHAFMVHLQGEWGAGKSTFLNLIKNQLNTGDRKWIIVNYNAWKNQHLTPPWWTFLDQIYQQTKSDENFSGKRKFKIAERFRRIKYYTAWQKVLALALTIVFIGLILYFGNTILEFIVNLFSNSKIDGEGKGLAFEVFAKLIISIGSLLGLFYSISKFLTTPFFMTSSQDASSFMKQTSDPLKRIKDHFKHLVADINKKHQLAIFIDDIDRCDRKFLVELLEGIQTLFKEEKVLYIVAGDKQWISKAFQNQYQEFDTERETNQNHLGDLFIRKAFQLSIRMPQVSETKKKRFWDHILGVKAGIDNKSREIEELDQKEKQEFEREMNSISDEEIAIPEVLDRIEKQFNVSTDEVSKRAIERKNAANEELKHLLADFHHLLDANPRSIIRLANFYTMTRSTLIAERRNTRPNLLFRWLILKESYPSALRMIGEVKDMKEFKDKLDKSDLSSELKSKCTLLIDGEKEQDKLTIEIIKELEGL